MARFTSLDGKPPAITVNKFGKGRAIYVATPAQPQIMRPLLRQLMGELGIARGPATPKACSHASSRAVPSTSTRPAHWWTCPWQAP